MKKKRIIIHIPSKAFHGRVKDRMDHHHLTCHKGAVHLAVKTFESFPKSHSTAIVSPLHYHDPIGCVLCDMAWTL